MVSYLQCCVQSISAHLEHTQSLYKDIHGDVTATCPLSLFMVPILYSVPCPWQAGRELSADVRAYPLRLVVCSKQSIMITQVEWY